MRREVPFGAHAPASRDGRPLPPADAAVPQLAGLLDAPAMATVLARCLRSGAAVEDLRVTLVDYVPGSAATVAYDVTVEGARHSRSRPPATRSAPRPSARTPAARSPGRSGARARRSPGR